LALECLRCHNCESGRGCARGIATTDPELVDLMTIDWGSNRISNMYYSWSKILKEILRRLGLKSIRELVGRTDTLAHLDYFDRPVDDDLRR
jgi:glutamate synthase domain-containing protein 2